MDGFDLMNCIAEEISNASDNNIIGLDDINSSYYGDYYEYYVNDYKNETRGEVALWRAVLLQAFIDLKTKSKKHVNKPIKREAVKWFRVNKRDLMDVCALADYDYRMVAKKAEEILAENSSKVGVKKRI
jgi:hypothetical protein